MTGSRRAFLIGAGGAAGAVALAAGAVAATAPGRHGIPLLSTRIAPSGHDVTGSALRGVRVGDVLALRREPDNDYDRRAVAVHARSGERLGYVPRAHNEALANLLDAGIDTVVLVRDVRIGTRPEVRIDVALPLAV